jgi:hypothetical protein
VSSTVPAPTSHQVCPQCGAGLAASDRFCAVCGTAVAPALVAPVRLVRPPLYDEPPASRFGSKSKIALAMVAVIGLLAVIFVLAGQRRDRSNLPSGGTADHHDLAGTIIVEHSVIVVGPDGCIFPAPNEALVPGAPISVLNEDDVAIASGAILHSALVDDGVCHLVFAVPDIPEARAYQLVINGITLPAISHRDFELVGWNVQVRINDFQEDAAAAAPLTGQMETAA